MEGSIRVPGEWAPQQAIWTAWPANPHEWQDNLEMARRDCAALIRTLAEHGNKVRVLVNGSEAMTSASGLISEYADLIASQYGDIWLRDIAPIFAKDSAGRKIALKFATNSWGGKYDLPEDAYVAGNVARLAGTPIREFDFVLEGGAVDHDGEGTILTTRQTLLNANRNGWTRAEAEDALRKAFDVTKVIWIDEGLKNDHTDGHIDNVARFVGPGRVVCQAPADANDPNAETLDVIAETLAAATDGSGRKLEVIRIPGVGEYRNKLGDIAPASHMNFIIANGVVVVPTYGTMTELPALNALQDVFADRRVVGISSHGLIGCGHAGGGSFHCITQQEPA